MTTMSATRRSPRTIEKFCNKLIIAESINLTATLYSIATCAGWSADRISITIERFFHVKIPPEAIWDIHDRWSRTRKPFNYEDRVTMGWMMGQIGLHVYEMGRPLNMTPRPISIVFQPTWSPKNNHGKELCPGFSPQSREESKLWMMGKNDHKIYGLLTPIEEPIIEKFGKPMRHLMEKVLQRWAMAMLSLLETQDTERQFAPINEKVQVDLIMNYLRYFQKKYEKVWGFMEEIRGAGLGDGYSNREQAVHIQSTGYGAKVLVGLLMADRLHVVDRLRFAERARIGYREVKPEDLKENCKNCAICQERIGEKCVEAEEVYDEVAVELVVCCGNTIGITCLREWMKPHAGNGCCPICRHRFSMAFCEKLMEGVEDKDSAEKNEKNLVQHSVIEIRSPTPESMPDPGDIDDEDAPQIIINARGLDPRTPIQRMSEVSPWVPPSLMMSIEPEENMHDEMEVEGEETDGDASTPMELGTPSRPLSPSSLSSLSDIDIQLRIAG